MLKFQNTKAFGQKFKKMFCVKQLVLVEINYFLEEFKV